MKPATIKELKSELSIHSQKDLMDVCLRLAKFKKENKELLTYLLFEAENESDFIKNTNEEVSLLFSDINKRSLYYVKKSVRKILSKVTKHIRYSQKKATEAELLLHFCKEFKTHIPNYKRSTILKNMYSNQVDKIVKAVNTLHEDLQYDYENAIAEIIS